ncbi:MAG: succinate dehydrogenase cytochrome b subunit [Propionibacteriaceae bacterium]|nr:succinate dehydrogenase cytochrome b subunit [Propionibacteriaceae bacterium]
MKKVIMAVTGICLIVFLLMHMFGNLKVFIGEEAFNHYAHWLKGSLPDGGILEPFMPHGWFIWLFRAFMAACLVLHVYCALKVWRAAVRGRGSTQGKKYTRVNRPERTFSAKVTRWGGITLGLLLVFHLLMFTTKTIRTGFGKDAEPYDMFTASFSLDRWYIFAIYVVFMLAVSFHVRHGFYSAFTTLGANVSTTARSVLNGLAYFVATLIFVGFTLPPAASTFGLL